MSAPSARTTGLLLAAGAGRRYGGPKALARSDGEAWVVRSARALLDGGCGDVLVVTGAEADGVERVLADAEGMQRVATTFCGTWEQGMGESLRAGLTSLVSRGRTVPLLAVVHLVDLPDVGAEVVARLLDEGGARPSTLARAAYRGTPGHPVSIGQEHWQQVLGGASGDAGARAYLRRARPALVECGDLASGRDVDEQQGGI
ncbi:CTP:molybdopterin cytidylyltransferase [Serinicoccus hydrothermalis]|uniref:CTP:molybdopterin cytidylyltransferase n=1 Tax=Serinicoccus hydrothermalis TaxID=1758689 RepID=A0A1B1N8F3_9MICO|nr:nucleotidyltransferase family protein [Serinicoccus hydrothermalis]ANS77698.1 CTP:molybdopterin cytidylyltransferase [Serinicoccus hydrothermalis]